MNRTTHRSEQIVKNLWATMAASSVDNNGEVACKRLHTKPATRCRCKDDLVRATMMTLPNLMARREGSAKPMRPTTELSLHSLALINDLLATLKLEIVYLTRFLAQADTDQPIFDKIARLNDYLRPNIVLG